jgi:hypothetical protein
MLHFFLLLTLTVNILKCVIFTLYLNYNNRPWDDLAELMQALQHVAQGKLMQCPEYPHLPAWFMI